MINKVKEKFNVDYIKEVYERLNINSVFGTFVGENNCACPLSILTMEKSGKSLSYMNDYEDIEDASLIAFITDTLGITVSQANAFWHGFDELPCHDESSEFYKLGRQIRKEFDSKHPGFVRSASYYYEGDSKYVKVNTK